MNRCFLFLILILQLKLGYAQEYGKSLFNEDWKFHKGEFRNAQNESINDSGWRAVDLPHDFSIEGPFSKEWASGTGYLPGGIGWYRKSFNLEKPDPAIKTFIYFDGVYKNSEVWINGHYLGKRPNGYISFQYELSAYLKKGKNTIAVRVDHSKFADSRWYPGSGIYRNVYLIKKNLVYIPTWGLSFSTPQVSEKNSIAQVSVSLANSSASNASLRVEASLISGNKTFASISKSVSISASSNQDLKFTLPVDHPKLWSPETPGLYTLNVRVLKDGKLIDAYKKQVGFRNIRFDANDGFFLNGKNMKLKGVCVHHDAGALGAAVPEEVWLRRLMKLKEVGCNAIRMSHYPHQDYMYDLCDQLGFLVMDEAFDEWEEGKNKWIEGWNVGKPGRDGYHEDFKEWAERDLRDMVLRTRNHPSIIMWSIGNEIDYPNDPYTHEVLSTGRNPQIYGKGYQQGNPPASRLAEISKRLVEVVKQVDTTRPVTAALAGVVMSNTTSYPQNLDIVGYNYQEYRYEEDHKAYPGRIIYGSENGKNAEAWRAVDTSKNIFGQFLWTGFDFMGEARIWPVRSSGAGLLDLAGFPKTDFYARQALWLDKPMTFLTVSKITEGSEERSWRNNKPSWNWEKGDIIRVNCITNANKAELFLNRKSLGVKTKSDNIRGLFWELSYEPGELMVKSLEKTGKAAASFSLKTSSEPSHIGVTVDKRQLIASEKGVAHVEIQIQDKEGNAIFEADNEVAVQVEGPAVLLGLESGDLASHEDYKLKKRKIYNGKLLAYVQSTGRPGDIKITISSVGLKPVSLTLKSGR
ncbi:glycoside hydrolase family 2 TIM barrel-domain containing protein [Desertivirga arenae]|uniref:glycoside hydrolase family 2 TIM barrel-domain containing protein n=1 Tax=Desertivirga arenae TaxID=2810309 RepID=UPI001A978BD3|nr:glycoside hydrolase family 2 TIM barrel-domain containing protein [Pedobacter sp. SYSU D00823]